MEVDRRGIGSRLGWHVELLSMVAATSTTALAPIVAATPVRERHGPLPTLAVGTNPSERVNSLR